MRHKFSLLWNYSAVVVLSYPGKADPVAIPVNKCAPWLYGC